MNLYIGDTHFGHSAAIRFDARPFKNVREMDRYLITMWNNKVKDEDDVFIVGDFAHKNEKPEEWYLQQLKGHKHLIIGNHDSPLVKNEQAMSYFDSVHTIAEIVDEGRRIYICHFPLASWERMEKGAYHIYAHIHKKKDEVFNYMKKRETALNAGCMINHYTPVSLEELIKNNRIFQRG